MRSKMNSTLVGVFTITMVFLSSFVNMVGDSEGSQLLLSPLCPTRVAGGGSMEIAIRASPQGIQSDSGF